ncbi:Hypothetical predicted protein [Cloeon dipterum]|uniref:Syntaxin N-terminal domain-containing protein n=1 Tax=Cloeon dipterum TaxID=197152 RepID=A0A8S1DZM3_9INSE|nr:Hypothetical predicted protein [Cloeon dipterum]
MSERFSRRSIVLGRRGSSYTGLQGPATPSHFPSHLINAEPAKLIAEINTQVATFRDLLIHVGHQSKDGPEMRERIRKLRRQCVEAFKHSVQLILPQIRRCVRRSSALSTTFKIQWGVNTLFTIPAPCFYFQC